LVSIELVDEFIFWFHKDSSHPIFIGAQNDKLEENITTVILNARLTGRAGNVV
jgi:hypothetical protein